MRGAGGSEAGRDRDGVAAPRRRDRRQERGELWAGRHLGCRWGAAVQAAARFDRGVPWRIGQTVAHARFGEGVIVGIEGQGADARVQINFGRQGVKWLALSVARLDPVN